MHLKALSERLESPRVKELLLTVTAVLFVATTAHAQGALKTITRKDMDRVLVTQPISVTRSDADSQRLLKQINEDFTELRDLNTSMLAEVSARAELDYVFFSKKVSQIKGKASRLKSNLILPEASNETAKHRDFTDAATFKDGLLLLDQCISSFLANPLFQASVIDVELATKASSDLRSIIDVSEKLKKAAKKLKSGK